MDCTINNTEDNDVNETGSHGSGHDPGVASGNTTFRLQDVWDRHPATVATATTTETASQLHVTTAKNFRSKLSKIGSWNVRTLFQAGKLDNVIQEMDRMGLQCLGLCEVRWTQAGEFQKDQKRIFYSGGTQHQRGVGLILDKHFSRSVLSFWPKSDRTMLVKLKASPFNVNIIVVYAPTAEAEEEDIDNFYDSLNEVYSCCKSQEITIVMGDFNAKVGSERDGKVVGSFGLGERNDRGDKLVDWCASKGLFISNTWFETHPRRRYTWTSPGDRTRNQIDYIIINQRFRNAVKNSRAFPGADVNSDHNPVVAKFKLSLKRLKKPKRRPRYILSSLKISQDFKEAVIRKMPTIFDNSNTESQWKAFTSTIAKAAEDNIPKEENNQSQSSHWMTTEIKELMEQRRLLKRDQEQYNIVNREIQKKCREAKENWLEEMCQKVEHVSLNPKEMFKKINIIAGKKDIPKIRYIKAKDGRILQEEKEIKDRWVQYIQEELFHEEEEAKDPDLESIESGPPILKDEIRWALKNMKTDKSPGPDEIPVEMLIALDEEGIDMVWKLASNIYEEGKIPQDMMKSIFIALPKIYGTLDCSSHRTISLMNHTLKVLLKIILQRIRRQILPEIPNIQYGFMKDRGTRNAIFNFRMISERAIQHQQNIYAVFIDYVKAFDKVRHNNLLNMLKAINIDDKDLRLICNLYREQKATVRLSDSMTDWFEIRRGVRQGCVMSPDLFNLYSEMILRELEDRPEGILVNGVRINNLRYADDTVILASTEEELQSLFDTAVAASERLGLQINSKKTKSMVISKLTPEPQCNLLHGQAKIEQVSSFNYLGALVNSEGRCKPEIRRRIALSKDAFNRLRPLFTDRKLSRRIKIRVMKSFVWSVLLYGCESWTLTNETKRNLEAAEMWFYRRMLKISYVERVTNEEIMRRMETRRELLYIVEKRQQKFLGHIIRKGGTEDLCLAGRLPGKKARGGQRKLFLQTASPRQLWDNARRRLRVPHHVCQGPNRV